MADDLNNVDSSNAEIEDEESFNLNKFGFNMFKYLTSRTQENITFQDRELMLGIIRDVDAFKNKDNVKLRRKLVKYHGAFVTGAALADITLRIISAVRKEPYWEADLLTSLSIDAMLFLQNRYLNLDYYRGLKKVLSKYGLTPNQFYRIVTDKKLMETLINSSYVTMYENDPFKSLLFNHNDFMSILAFVSCKSNEAALAYRESSTLRLRDAKKYDIEESNRRAEFFDFIKDKFQFSSAKGAVPLFILSIVEVKDVNAKNSKKDNKPSKDNKSNEDQQTGPSQ